MKKLNTVATKQNTVETLGVNGEAIQSNSKRVCARCGLLIDAITDSGWEVFVEAGTTQPICVFCEDKEKREMSHEKVETSTQGAL